MENLLSNIGYSNSIVQALVEANKDAHIFQVMVTLLHPTDRGSVKIRSNSPKDAPIITSNYLKTAEDVEILVSGINEFKCFEETRMFNVHEIEYINLPLPNCENEIKNTDSYWKCYIKDLATTGHDQVGSSKMGPQSDREAVVDSRLKVHNVDGLRIIDNSIMPDHISGGTLAAAVMIGERGADFIKEDWKIKS